MLPGIGGGELVVIAVIALIVVGPKDLPKMLRQLGRFVGKMRSMADDFRSSFEDMARQSELDDLRKEVEALRNMRTLPGLEDVKTEIDSVDREIHDNLHAPYMPAASDVTPVPVVDPLMEGLPPRGAVETEVAPVVVKKPRARKTQATTVNAPAKTRRSKSTVS